MPISARKFSHLCSFKRVLHRYAGTDIAAKNGEEKLRKTRFVSILGKWLPFPRSFGDEIGNQLSFSSLSGKDFFDTRSGRVLADLNFADHRTSANSKSEVSYFAVYRHTLLTHELLCFYSTLIEFLFLLLCVDCVHSRSFPSSKQR